MREPVPIKRVHPNAEPTREYHRTNITSLKKTLPSLMARISDTAIPVADLLPLEIAAREYRLSLLQDLGGIGQCTMAQRSLVSILVGSWLVLNTIDTYMIELAALNERGLINRRRQKVLQIVEQRMRIADSFAKQLTQLGLTKHAPPIPTIDDVIRAQRTNAAPEEPAS